MKGYCLSIVQAGVNKCISNEAIIENYEVAYNGVNSWAKFVSSSTTTLQSNTNTEVAPPVKVALNKDNISVMERALLETYQYEP